MNTMGNRIVFVIFCLTAAFLLLIGRSASLQLFPQQKLTDLKERQFEKTVKVTPRRGVIYDRNGEQLAVSVPSQSLFVDPYKIDKPYYAAKKISKVLNIPKKTLLKKFLNKKRRFVWVKRHLTDKEYKQVKAKKFKGFHFIKESKRFYTMGNSMSQVLGFTNIDGKGLEGIEKTYDKFLRGEEQRVVVKRDAIGRPLFSDFTPFVSQVSGFDIYLTIDSSLQFYFEKELQKAMEVSNAKSAMGLVMSVDTSEILAMVNLPNYNPNKPLQLKNKNHRRNRTVTDVFEPGSTLKTFTTVAAIQSGISPSKKYPTHNGKLQIGKKIITEAETDKKFKPFLSLPEILAYSSNIGAALLSFDVGQKKVRKTLDRFGFGEETGIDFIGESSGKLRSLPWRDIELATISYGHGVSATAIQMARAYTAIANGGFLKTPRLVKQIHNSYNGEERFFKNKDKGKSILTNHESQIMTLMLASVTDEGGTGEKAVVPGYLTAGKTGTAKKIDFEKGGYKESEYISSFAGFIPANKPEYVIYVVIDGATNNFYASLLAAPVFSKVASYNLRKNGVPPTFLKEENLILAEKDSKKDDKVERKIASFKNTVPNLKGLSLRELLTQVEDKDIKLKIYGSNRVIRTVPFAGEALPQNKTITVILN